MRKHAFTSGEYYHIYTHAVGDLVLFKNDREYKRFLTTFFTANSLQSIPRLDRPSTHDLNSVWNIRDGKTPMGTSLVDIVSFVFMPNHFHALLRERGNGNISIFMHKLLVSYAKYINQKYDRRGHVFESKFHSRHIDSNEYLLKISAYLHLNPKNLLKWHRKEHQYPWSSFQDYIGENRWRKLLARNTILEQFDFKKQDYRRFVEESRGDDDEFSSHLT